MRISASLALASLAVLLGSCEYVTNTGFACLIPQELECECPSLDTDDGNEDCTTPSLPLDDWEYQNQPPVCTGKYPGNASYEVAVYLYEGGQGYSVKEKCKVKVDGQAIVIKGHFWHEPERDAIVEPGATASCSVGKLAPGLYTLVYGDAQLDIQIGDADSTLPMHCVESGKVHTS
jgi:hypothetical protein